jgi:hypothetical protein
VDGERRVSRVAAAVAWLTAASVASAACPDVLRRETARFAKTAREAVGACEADVLAGRLPATADCRTEPRTAALVTAAAGRLTARLAGRCCGADRTCGTADDASLAAVGWTSPACPSLENAACTGAVADPGDVAACLTCAGRAAMERLVELLHERYAPAVPASVLAGCQAAIGEASTRFFVKTTKALRRCWDARARGGHANDCPAPGDGRAERAIARARDALADAVCRACGGGDARCGGGDDLTPAAIGFLAACPGVVPPGGAACAGPVAGLPDLARCAACVSEFAAGCLGRLAAPGLVAYPAECNPPRPPCGTAQCETSLDCPSGYTCRDQGLGTRACAGVPCAADAECSGGLCRPDCTIGGCGAGRCQCPGFTCPGPDQVCLASGEGLACHLLCTQDSDCTDPFGLVCINAGFEAGLCIGTVPCQ